MKGVMDFMVKKTINAKELDFKQKWVDQLIAALSMEMSDSYIEL